MNKIAIVTSICGLESNLPNPIKFEGVDYIAFVDRPHKSDIWQQKNALNFSLDNEYQNRRNAKIFKVLPHLFLPNYDYWFWVDSTHDVILHPQEIINNYIGDNEIGLWYHTHRDCVYKEAEVIKEVSYDHQDLVDGQMNYYKSQNYPQNNGLYELPVSIRKNTDNIKILNLRWWEQICKYSSRDQLSLPFVLWKTNIKPIILPGKANGGLNQNPIMPQTRNKGYV